MLKRLQEFRRWMDRVRRNCEGDSSVSAVRQMIRDIELGGNQESLRCAQTVGYRAERVGGSGRALLSHALRSS